MELFKDFPNQSRIWLFQSDRILNEGEMKYIDREISQFADEWAAHGNKLSAAAKVLNAYFTIIVVNDDFVLPSGCSVDALNTFMKNIGKNLDVDFFNRLKVVIDECGTIRQIPFSSLKQYSDVLIYDTLITNLGELRTSWPKPIKESNFASAF